MQVRSGLIALRVSAGIRIQRWLLVGTACVLVAPNTDGNILHNVTTLQGRYSSGPLLSAGLSREIELDRRERELHDQAVRQILHSRAREHQLNAEENQLDAREKELNAWQERLKAEQEMLVRQQRELKAEQAALEQQQQLLRMREAALYQGGA